MKLTREEKRNYRLEMMKIIGNRSINDLSQQELTEVQQINNLIENHQGNVLPPLPKKNIQEFTYEEYRLLRRRGYQVKEIRWSLNAGSSVWKKWREAHLPEKKSEGEM